VAELVDELAISIEKRYVIVNRFAGNVLPQALEKAVKEVKAEFLGVVPYDATLAEFEFTGRPLIELDGSSPVYQTVRAMCKRALARRKEGKE
jgi:CO dehydrogenase nickel-insertion accessory protein CooC1